MRAPQNTSHSAPTSIGSPSDVPVPCISSEATSAGLHREGQDVLRTKGGSLDWVSEATLAGLPNLADARNQRQRLPNWESA